MIYTFRVYAERNCVGISMTWSLGKKDSEVEVQNLSEKQLLAFLRLCLDSREKWIIRKTNESTWNNPVDVIEIWSQIQERPLEVIPSKVLPFPQIIPQASEVGTSKINEGENRKHKRYNIRLRVLIRFENIVFRSFTKDISKGGMAIEHPLPAALHGQICAVQFHNVDSGIGLKLSLRMTDRPGDRYFTFTDLTESENKMLETFLEPESNQEHKFNPKVKKSQ